MSLIKFKSVNRPLYDVLNKLLNFFYNDKNTFGKDFKKNGYKEIKLENLETIKLIKEEIDLQKEDSQKNLVKFKINKKIFDLLNNLIAEQKKLINYLKEYYFCPVVVSNIELRRTKYFDKSLEINSNVYSENYHVDKYVNTHVKQFIYLTDVDENSGPFSYIDKKNTKNFVKEYQYRDRFSIKIDGNKNLETKKFEKKFTGKIGSSLIVNTTECLHRAGIPVEGKHRDIITITYIAVPEKKYNDERYFFNTLKEGFFDNENSMNITKRLAKPFTKKDIFLFLFRFLKYRYFN